MTERRFPTLRARPEDIAPRILVVGDPKRAEAAAGLLSAARQVGANREYVSYTGEHQGTPVSVISHGVGASGASLAFQELLFSNCQAILRAGTCGAMQAEIEDGELIIATGAVREDGTSGLVVPMEYPAVCDWRAVAALSQASAKHQVKVHTGVVLTRGVFYPGLLPEPYELYIQAGVKAVEMELAVLLVLAGLKGVAAGGIFVSDGNVARQMQSKEHGELFAYNPHRPVVAAGIDTMLRVALDALVQI